MSFFFSHLANPIYCLSLAQPVTAWHRRGYPGTANHSLAWRKLFWHSQSQSGMEEDLLRRWRSRGGRVHNTIGSLITLLFVQKQCLLYKPHRIWLVVFIEFLQSTPVSPCGRREGKVIPVHAQPLVLWLISTHELQHYIRWAGGTLWAFKGQYQYFNIIFASPTLSSNL